MSNSPTNNNVTPENESEIQEYVCIAEVMMSAGPRKELDTELGEDVAGVLVSQDYAFFWIADGTSESDILRDEQNKVYFSSRLLAQEIAINFHFRALGLIFEHKVLENKNAIKDMLLECIEEVVRDWKKVLKNISSESQEYLNTIFSKRQENSLFFSTTFLGGFLSKKGILQAAFYGDSPLIVVQGKNGEIIREENYRFFMRLDKEGEHFSFTTSTKHEIVDKFRENVDVVLAGSDGIGKLPEFMKEQSKHFEFLDTWGRLYKFSPRTNDDKTVCLLTRRRLSKNLT